MELREKIIHLCHGRRFQNKFILDSSERPGAVEEGGDISHQKNLHTICKFNLNLVQVISNYHNTSITPIR